ncbi:MAG: AbiV family abortive infection protein [Candidatus Heimdallarchaeota archaeon]
MSHDERDFFRRLTIKYHENALQFLKDAECLIENASYGHAYALLVLGFEEWAKSMNGLGFLSGYYKTTDRDVMSAMRDHVWKQGFGLSTIEVFAAHALLEESPMKEDYTILGQNFNEGKIDYETFQQELRRLLRKDTSEIASTYSGVLDVIEEFNENPLMLDERKQAGLYVDFKLKQREIHSPLDDFSRDKLLENLQTYRAFITVTDGLIEGFKDPQDVEGTLEDLHKWGSAMRTAIEEAFCTACGRRLTDENRKGNLCLGCAEEQIPLFHGEGPD